MANIKRIYFFIYNKVKDIAKLQKNFVLFNFLANNFMFSIVFCTFVPKHI